MVDDATPLANAVRELLDDASYVDAARRIADEIRALPPVTKPSSSYGSTRSSAICLADVLELDLEDAVDRRLEDDPRRLAGLDVLHDVVAVDVDLLVLGRRARGSARSRPCRSASSRPPRRSGRARVDRRARASASASASASRSAAAVRRGGRDASASRSASSAVVLRVLGARPQRDERDDEDHDRDRRAAPRRAPLLIARTRPRGPPGAIRSAILRLASSIISPSNTAAPCPSRCASS